MKKERAVAIKEYSYLINDNDLLFSQKKHSIFKEFNKIKTEHTKFNILKEINNYYFSDGFDGIKSNKKETTNNHIIPCSYFAQWTKFLTRNGKLINKKSKPRLNYITYKGKSNTYLNDFMQIDSAFVNMLEEMFLNGGSEKCYLRDRLQYFIEQKYIKDVDFILFRKYDGEKFNCENKIAFYHDELIKQENENYEDFCKRKSDIIKFINFMESDSFLSLNVYISLFYERQKCWNILKGNSVKNILEEVIKEYKKTKSFEKYKSIVHGIHQLLKKTMFKNSKSKYLIHGCDLEDKENIFKFLTAMLKHAEKNKYNYAISKRINSLYICDLALNVKFNDMFIYIMSTEEILSIADFPIFKSKRLNSLYFPLSPNLLLFMGNKSTIKCINVMANENKQDLINIYEKEFKERKDCEEIKLKE